MKSISVFFLMTVICAYSPVRADERTAPPPQAIGVGYSERTFTTFLCWNIDLKDMRQSSHDWFRAKFFGWDSTPREDIVVNDAGPLIIKTGYNYGLATAAPGKDGKPWVGKAFGGGGYFEAEIKFDPQDVLATKGHGWPSFWGMAIEHMANLPGEHWPGQPKGYSHFIEVDFFEYLFAEPGRLNVYGGNMHDWYGIYQKTCPGEVFCKHSIPYRDVQKHIPQGTNLNEYHKYGFLWVPATDKTNGWAQFYFDDQPVGGIVRWEKYTEQPPSTRQEPWTFGILDEQHLVLILGTGSDQPMTIRSVSVWQGPGQDNISQ